MRWPRSVSEQNHTVIAVLVIVLIVLGSIIVRAIATGGDLVPTGTYPTGTVLEVASSSAGSISLVGSNMEITVESSPTRTKTAIVLESTGFQRDLRAQAGTFGLRMDTIMTKATGTKRLAIVVPENGTLVLTLVGDARLVLTQAKLAELRLTGASSTLELDASASGSAVNAVQIDSVAGDFTGTRLGNLNAAQVTIGSIAGNYTLDFSGALDRRCDVILHSAFGDGTLRVAQTPGAQISIGSVLGHILSPGFTVRDGKVFLNSTAATGAEQRLHVRIDSAIGQIQFVEVHS